MYDKISCLEEVDPEKLDTSDYTTLALKEYIEWKRLKFFTIKNVIYGFTVDVPNYSEVIWVSYHFNNKGLIVFDRMEDLSRILEFLDQKISDELIFNLDLVC